MAWFLALSFISVSSKSDFCEDWEVVLSSCDRSWQDVGLVALLKHAFRDTNYINDRPHFLFASLVVGVLRYGAIFAIVQANEIGVDQKLQRALSRVVACGFAEGSKVRFLKFIGRVAKSGVYVAQKDCVGWPWKLSLHFV